MNRKFYRTAGFVCILGLLVLAGYLQPPTAAAQQANILTPYHIADLQSVGTVALSPDGKHLAYTRSIPADPFQENKSARSELHIVDLESGEDRLRVPAEVGAGTMAWTPDGAYVSFLARGEGDAFTSLYVLPARGGEARRAVSVDRNVGSYAWSPDGRRVAFIASEPGTPAATTLPVSPTIYEEDVPNRKVWIAQAFEPDAALRLLGHEGTAHAVHWSPQGDNLAVALAPTPTIDDRYMYQRVHILDAGRGDVLARIENPGKLGAIAWSPDGTHLAMISGADINDPKEGRLLVAPATGGAPIDVLPNLEGHVRALVWTDAETLHYLAGVGVESVYDWVHRDGSSHKRLVATSGLDLTGLSVAGTQAAFTASTPEHPNEVYVMEVGERAPRRLTHSNPSLDGVRLARQEVVRYQARDGLDLEGLLIRPLDEETGWRYPLVLVVHGGPEAHYSNGWLTSYSSLGQMAAARGMAVFYPNYRGSTGRGVAFSKTSQADPAGKEFDDLVDAVDHLIETGLVDRDRVGVTGGSYGGYATGWLSTRYSDRFAAGVMFVGISNKVSKVGTTDIPNEEYFVHARKRPWDNWQFFLERSSIYYADQGRTPLLIMHGEEEPRVNPGQSMELYRHLKLRGQAPVRLVFYPGEGHGNRNAAARLDYSLRAMRWMEHFLTGPGGEMPPYPIDVEAPVEITAPGR